jgi:hypothetical protein
MMIVTRDVRRAPPEAVFRGTNVLPLNRRIDRQRKEKANV